MVVFLLFAALPLLLLGICVQKPSKKSASSQPPGVSQRSSTLTPTKSHESQSKAATPLNPRSPTVPQQTSKHSLKFDIKSNKSAATEENLTNLDSVIGTEDNPLKDQRVIAKLRGESTPKSGISPVTEPDAQKTATEQQKNTVQMQSNRNGSRLLDLTMDTVSPNIFESSRYVDVNLRHSPSTNLESKSKHFW